jgi:hypothetical protein
MILKFGLDHRDKPWYRAQNVGGAAGSAAPSLLAAYLLLYRIAVLAYPYCVEIPKDANPRRDRQARRHRPVEAPRRFAGVLPFLAAALVHARPLAAASARLSALIPARIRPPPWPLDQGWLRRWLLGRRVWLSLGLMFHGFLILFMNIGMFPFIMLMTYAAWLTGEEFAAGLRWCTDSCCAAHRSAAACPARGSSAPSSGAARPRPPRTSRRAAGRSPISSSSSSASASSG